MNVILMGYGDCGKGTACKFLMNELGVSSISSSFLACKLFMFEKLKDQFGYKTEQECYDDRRNYRAIWYNEIRAFNDEDLCALGKILFANYTIYDGIRNKEEFYALKEQGLFDLAIWIDSSERIENESADSMSLSKEDADIVLLNNGTEKEFLERILRLFKLIIR